MCHSLSRSILKTRPSFQQKIETSPLQRRNLSPVLPLWAYVIALFGAAASLCSPSFFYDPQMDFEGDVILLKI